MSSRSRSNSASSASSSSSESDHDNTEQLLEAARKAAAAKTTTSHGLDAQADLVSLGSSKPIAPVASTSKVAAVPRELPQDNFGQLPRKHLSKKQYRATQEKSAGRNWFDMPAAPKEPSEELKREVAALKLGAAIDPKRFLRGEAKRDAGKLPEYFQVRPDPPSNTLYAFADFFFLDEKNRWGMSWLVITQRLQKDADQEKQERSVHSSKRLQRTSKSE